MSSITNCHGCIIIYSQLMNIAAVVKLILACHIKTARQHAVNLHQVHATLSSLFAKQFVQFSFTFLHWSWLQLIMFLFYRPWAYSSALPNEPWVRTSGGAASNWPESPVWFRLSADCSPANRTHCVAGKILYLDGQIIWIIHDTGYYKYSEHSMVALLPAYFKNGLLI